MDFSHGFAQAIRERRKELKLSQEALADRLDSNQRYISEIESCLKNPTVKYSYDLARALDISLSELIAHTESIIQEKSSG